jgi:hypothetical protein
MLKFASLLAFCAALFGATTLAAIAGPSDRSVLPRGSYQVADETDDIVCCSSRGQTSYMPRSKCARHHFGSVVNGRLCRHDANTSTDTLLQGSEEQTRDWNETVCCARGGHASFITLGQCINQHRRGVVVNNARCRADANANTDTNTDTRFEGSPDPRTYDPDEVVCCRREGQTMFRPYRRCSRFGEHPLILNNAQCRHDANTSSDTLDSGDNDGHGHVCCEKDGHVWWAGKKECALQRADIVSPHRCS